MSVETVERSETKFVEEVETEYDVCCANETCAEVERVSDLDDTSFVNPTVDANTVNFFGDDYYCSIECVESELDDSYSFEVTIDFESLILMYATEMSDGNALDPHLVDQIKSQEVFGDYKLDVDTDSIELDTEVVVDVDRVEATSSIDIESVGVLLMSCSISLFIGFITGVFLYA